MSGVESPVRSGRVRWTRALSLATAIGVLASAAVHRFANTNHLLWASDEMVTLMAGIRLHLLPWWNFGADARDNFFKSLVMPVHGLGDNVFFYGVVWLFRWLHLPVTEANLFSAGAVLSMASLVILFALVRRLFGIGAGLLALALVAWNQTLIGFAVKGFQVNFIIFLQLACPAVYVLHVTKNRWSSSLLMTALMVLCAGSELFYLAPFFLLLHLACLRTIQPAAGVGLLDRKNLVVWSGYGLMLLVDIALYFIVGRRLALTLFGQLAVKRQLGSQWMLHYGPGDFVHFFNQVFSDLPHAAEIVFVATILLLLTNRRAPYAVLFGLSLAGLMVLAYLMKFAMPANFAHLIIPVIIVVSVVAAQGISRLLSWVLRQGEAAHELAGVLCVAAIIPLAAPWQILRWDQPGEPYRCIKAVGYALRELGRPGMDIRVMFLSDHAYIPTTMEFYTGLCASWDDNEPTRLFYLRAPRPDYLPSRIAERVGLDRFDHYVDFTKEHFPMKPEVLADVRPLKLHEVYRIMDGDSVCATIASPRPGPSRVLSVEEGNAAFNRTYAYWPRLFSSVNVGAFWYYDANY